MEGAAARKVYRAQLTKLVNNAKPLITATEPDVEELIVVRDRLQLIWDALQEANCGATDHLEAAAREDELTKIVEYNDTAMEMISRINFKLKKSERIMGNNANSNSEASRSATPNSSGKKSNIKLPKLELRKFNGDLSTWTPFWEQFKTAIHENEDLDAVSKFNYLQTLLIGKAAATISGLTPTEACYDDAIEMLKNEYGNQQRIIDDCIQKLMDIKPIKNRNDANALRTLYNTTSSITRTLVSLGVNADKYSFMVKSILLKTIPYPLKIEYHKKHYSTEATLEQQVKQLIEYIKLMAEALEFAQADNNCASSSNSGRNNASNKHPAVRRESVQPGSSKEFTAAGLFTQGKTQECLFCSSKTHFTENCDSTVTLDKKKDILKTNNRCFRCTRPGHSSKLCKTRNVLCGKCKGRHVYSMCDPNYKRPPKITGTNNASNTNALLNNLLISNEPQTIYLQTAKGYIANVSNEKDAFVRLIIDGGSQLTYIKQDISRMLNLEVVGRQDVAVISFGSREANNPKSYNKVRFNLYSQYHNEPIQMTALEVPDICYDALVEPNLTHPLIDSLNMADTCASKRSLQEGISLLIGCDYYWKVVTGEHIRISDKLTAVNSNLGWTLQGPTSNVTSIANLTIATNLHVQVQQEEDELYDIRKFWDLETLGIKAAEASMNNISDDFIHNEITYKRDRYEVNLPWKKEIKISDNQKVAHVRLKTLTNRLKQKSLLKDYDLAIREYINNDIAEKVLDEDKNQNIYYMPHRAVYRDDKSTTKVRVVFDASAHDVGCTSLNENLLIGDNFVPDLLQTILNFRIGCIGITADIEKAFLQIKLSEKDRDVHRFYWFDKPITDENNLPKIVPYRMKRVTFGVASSPFLLAATLRKHFLNQHEHFPQTCDILKNCFYVDDCVVSLDNEDEAIKFYNEAKVILNKAGMNLRKWKTNNHKLKEFIDQNEKEAQVNVTDEKILGLKWNARDDSLSVNFNPAIEFVTDENCITKRKILQTIARIFDPLGMLGSFSIKIKILLQEIWKLKLSWDEEVPEEFTKQFKAWCKDLQSLKSFEIPRMTAITQAVTELHVFCDSSKAAYGAVAYLKQISANNISVKFVIAKNRVAPLKDNGSDELKLPKLELTSCVCAARLQDYIVKTLKLKIHHIYLWTDSRISLCWIQGPPSKWKPYVSNRVREIQGLSKSAEWRHCPGNVNPADLLTRGVSAKVLKSKKKLWLSGPEWLLQPMSYWPSDNNGMDCKDINVKSIVCLSSVENSIKNEPSESIFPIKKYEGLEKCFRITALIKRAFRNQNKGTLKISELRDAENYWIKETQRTFFAEDLEDLQRSGSVKKTSKVYSLSPFIDEIGIMRLGGRLQEADLDYETKHPIILPKNSPFTEKLIEQSHKVNLHGGTQLILSEIRRKYWIIKGRQKIKTVLQQCVTCKKLKGKGGNEIFAPLPRNRIVPSRSFEHTGLDFAGPLYVKNDGDSKAKSYVLLLTCAVSRAVHLELVLDLSAESCMRALRRFVSRRGVPSTIYSDNAKTFKRASLELQELNKLIIDQKVQAYLQKKRIKWNFIVERAAWWGGWWERMVKTVKDNLKFALGRSLIGIEELRTVLTEVEAIINKRPLTYIDDDPNNLNILTPAHLLLTTNNITFEEIVKPSNRNEILKQWSLRQKLKTKFWKRWQKDYLQQLRSAHNNVTPNNKRFQIGDVVLIHEQYSPRLAWKLARITDVFPGRDGKIRACEVSTANGKLRRPIQLLFPLEIPNAAAEDV